jgi:hypothetical protein
MRMFDDNQVQQIILGIQDGVDVSVYSNPEYHYLHMDAIRVGLKHGIDVSPIMEPSYPFWKAVYFTLTKIKELGKE